MAVEFVTFDKALKLIGATIIYIGSEDEFVERAQRVKLDAKDTDKINVTFSDSPVDAIKAAYTMDVCKTLVICELFANIEASTIINYVGAIMNSGHDTILFSELDEGIKRRTLAEINGSELEK